MTLGLNDLDLRRHPDKEGWFLLRVSDNYNYEEPPELWWESVSPKLRRFDYPGGPARGQLSKADFEWYLKILEDYEAEQSAPVEHQAAILRLLLSPV